MYFFADVSKSITTSTPLGNWSVAGYKDVHLHIWFQGPPNAVVYMEVYFNNLSAAQERIQLTAGGIAILTKVYPIFAPNVSVVLYNPTTPMNTILRLYAGCCPEPASLFRRITGPREAAAVGPVDIALLKSQTTSKP